MPVDQTIREALDLGKLPVPPRLPVEAIEVEDYVDWTGDPALRVQVILAEDTEVEKITGDEVSDLRIAIHDSLRARGITLWPYVFFAKRSELAEAAAED